MWNKITLKPTIFYLFLGSQTDRVHWMVYLKKHLSKSSFLSWFMVEQTDVPICYKEALLIRRRKEKKTGKKIKKGLSLPMNLTDYWTNMDLLYNVAYSPGRVYNYFWGLYHLSNRKCPRKKRPSPSKKC